MTTVFHVDRLRDMADRPMPAEPSPSAKIRAAGTKCVFERGAVLCQERRTNDHVSVLEAGLCVAIKRTRDGGQQNVAIYVTGDILDHETFTLGAATSTIVSLSPVTCHRVPLTRLRDLVDRDPEVALAFWRYVACQGAISHEWLLGMGRRPALERMAHLFCELVWRLRAAGEAGAAHCAFPLTQNDLSDLLGLSLVHVNRTLQRLRQTGCVALHRGQLEILDWTQLTDLAKFESVYLDLVNGA